MALLVWLVIDVWNAEALTDRLLQGVLLASAACGIWFVVNALQNLARNDKPWRAERREPLPSTPSR